ncbi:MAG: LD-carboxypeptidase [Halanaerobiales bacterium]|nr:LD-carboxypeptidase [Halanaerobiales bacterium]
MRYLRYACIMIFILINILTNVVLAEDLSENIDSNMVKKVKPLALKEGDTVGLVALASPVDKESLEKGIEYLREAGYNVLIGEHVCERNGYLAGADESRAEDLHNMFMNEDVKAIFCVRGGYGSARIIKYLDFDLIKNNPKIFMGYSDITFLLNAIYQKTGLITFHGPMVASDMSRMDSKSYNAQAMDNIIVKTTELPEISWHSSVESLFIKEGLGIGELAGGNLSIIISSIGTPYEIDTKGKILFLEEVGEPTYRIDRMLNQLKMTGKLDEIAGLVFGESVNCNPRYAGELTLLDLVKSYTEDLNVPVLFGVPLGHGFNKATLPIGAEVLLDSETGLFLLGAPVTIYER